MPLGRKSICVRREKARAVLSRFQIIIYPRQSLLFAQPPTHTLLTDDVVVSE